MPRIGRNSSFLVKLALRRIPAILYLEAPVTRVVKNGQRLAAPSIPC
jgi:hypothetical protein